MKKIAQIAKKLQEISGIPIDIIIGKLRVENIVDARQALAVISKRNGIKQKEIAIFMGKHHSSISHLQNNRPKTNLSRQYIEELEKYDFTHKKCKRVNTITTDNRTEYRQKLHLMQSKLPYYSYKY